MNLSKFIEYKVTNGIGYNTKTDFTRRNPRTYFRQPLEESDIRAATHAVRAHLANLERNNMRLRAISYFNILRNTPENHLFTKRSGECITLDYKQRRKTRKVFVRQTNRYSKIMNREISRAQSEAKWSVLKNGKDISNLIPVFLLSFSSEQ